MAKTGCMYTSLKRVLQATANSLVFTRDSRMFRAS